MKLFLSLLLFTVRFTACSNAPTSARESHSLCLARTFIDSIACQKVGALFESKVEVESSALLTLELH